MLKEFTEFLKEYRVVSLAVAFQQRYQLPVTGIADMATLKKLEKFSGVEVANDKASAYDVVLRRDLAEGMNGDDVLMLQKFLINAETYPEALVTGYFGGVH